MTSPGCTGSLRSRNQIVPSFSLQLKNPTRALTTTTLKCCLPSTDAIERREKIHTCLWGFKVASYKAASLNSIRFSRKQMRTDTFFNRIVYFIFFKDLYPHLIPSSLVLPSSFSPAFVTSLYPFPRPRIYFFGFKSFLSCLSEFSVVCLFLHIF